MNASANPYAPPRSFEANSPTSTDTKSIWRDGKDLVIVQGTRLPTRCVKCNAPGKPRNKPMKLWWHHSGYYLLVLMSPLIYLIAALIARKSAEVSPTMCDAHKKRRFNVIVIGWLGAIACFFGWIATAGINQLAFSLLVFVAMFGFIIFGMIKARIVYAKRIDNVYVRLRGCGEAFLATLPQFPG